MRSGIRKTGGDESLPPENSTYNGLPSKPDQGSAGDRGRAAPQISSCPLSWPEGTGDVEMPLLARSARMPINTRLRTAVIRR